MEDEAVDVDVEVEVEEGVVVDEAEVEGADEEVVMVETGIETRRGRLVCPLPSVPHRCLDPVIVSSGFLSIQSHAMTM